MLDELGARCVAGAGFAAEGGGEEEVLHVDYDEGGFGGGDGDGVVGGGLDGYFGSRGRLRWR